MTVVSGSQATVRVEWQQVETDDDEPPRGGHVSGFAKFLPYNSSISTSHDQPNLLLSLASALVPTGAENYSYFVAITRNRRHEDAEGRILDCDGGDSEAPTFDLQSASALFWGQRPRGRMRLVSAISQASMFAIEELDDDEMRVYYLKEEVVPSPFLPVYCNVPCPDPATLPTPITQIGLGQYVRITERDGACTATMPYDISRSDDPTVKEFVERCRTVAAAFGKKIPRQ
jgi:hypothetical protein